MIKNEIIKIVGIISILIETIGILIAERKSAMMLGLVTILTVIILFMI